ncbi:DNA-directed RNA polymerase subunit RPB1 [uncultured virus]|nr:DNA-directed RNA polymerase subunit RPB1 [uncultured virus]
MATPQLTVNALFAGARRKRALPHQTGTQIATGLPITGLNLPGQIPGFGATRIAPGQLPCPLQTIPVLSQPENAVTITKKERDEILTETANREAALPLLTIIKSAISLYSWEDMQRIAGPIRVTNLNLQGNGSVNDPRMGVVSLNVSCQYCSQIDCAGHYGLIEYRAPIYNPIVIREIVSVLTCVCNDCGGLLINEDVMRNQKFTQLPYDKRLAAMENYCKQDMLCLRQKPAIGGGAIVPCSRNPTFVTTDIKEKGEITYKIPQQGTKKATKEDPTHIMPIERVIDILDRISDTDARLLGFARGDHPRNMIMKGILVPPVIARPPVYEGGAIHHDQLTHMFLTIQRKVMDIANGKPGAVSELYTSVKQLIFKTEGKRMGMREFLSIIERIQGKQALLRGLLMGKRVNWCGRTVAGPDPSLRFGEIRIPEIWAPVLTKKIKVTEFNIHNLTALLEAGRITHITSKRTGLRKFYDARFQYRLQIGDIVERWLQNGDRIVVNRQPTLHRQSMMAYIVVLGHQLTIGLHLSYTTPMNCDFDGDENNAWNPQDFEVEAEVDTLMNVINNVMSAEQNKPIMGLVMNSVSGAYLLTKPDAIEKDATINEKPVADILKRATNVDLLQMTIRQLQNHNNLATLVIREYFAELLNLISKVAQREDLPILRNIRTQRGSPDDPVDANLIVEAITLATNIIDRTQEAGETLVQIYRTLNDQGKIITGTRIDDDLFAELLTLITDQRPLATLYQRLVKYGVHPRSGQAIFSAMLPENFYYNQKGVLILEGILVSGQLKKSHVGSSHRSIIQELWKNYGAQRTANFFTDAPWVINKWLIERGFSVGMLDCVNLEIDKQTGEEYDKNKRILEQELAKIYVQLEALGGKLNDPIEESFRQRQINNLVNIANGIGLRLAKDALSGDNSIGVMTDQGAGTKGGIANIGQMFGAVSQQYYHSQRLQPTITNRTRLLPAYDENDNNPEANAFIPVSFFTGLSAEGLFFLQAGGREGLLDTALKTAETGSMSHRMIKAFENIIIGYDGSIRNTIGTMFSPMYNSGYDIAEMVAVETKGKADFSSFIDLRSTIAELNVQRGWVPREVNETIVTQRQNVAQQPEVAENILPLPGADYVMGPIIRDTDPNIDIKQPVVRGGPVIKLTKFERSRIIGTRATQLSNNAPPLVEIGDEIDPVKIATAEYYAGVLTLYVVRKFADGTYQIVRPTPDNI